MIKSIEMGVLLSNSMLGRDNGRVFLELLGDRFGPERFNNFEPINRSFDEEGIEGALDLWGDTFLWRRVKPRLQGSYWTATPINPHEAFFLTLTLRSFKVDAVVDLWGQIADRFGIDFAYMHIRTDQDSKDLAYYKSHIMPFSQGLSTRHLREGIPDVPWALGLGPPYQKLFGARLATVPIHEKKEIATVTYLQLTDDPRDIDREREMVAEKRAAVKAHLNSAAFRGQEIDGRCRTPDF